MLMKQRTRQMTDNSLMRTNTRVKVNKTRGELLMKSICEFIGTDKITRGDWIGKYGKEGYLIVADEPNNKIPSYAKVYFRNNEDTLGFGYWWDEGKPVDALHSAIEKHKKNSMLYYDEKKMRRVAAFHEAIQDSSIYINIDIGDITNYFTIYLIDFTMMYRITEIGVYDEKGILLTAPLIISNFTEGVYVTFKISGKVSVVLDRILGQSVVFSAIFFDESFGNRQITTDIVKVGGNRNE